MLKMVRNHYLKSIEDSLGHIPEGKGEENIPRHVTYFGHIDETEVLTWNRGTDMGDDISPENYDYVDVGLTHHAPGHRELTYVGFWKKEGEDKPGRLTFSQWSTSISPPENTETTNPPIHHEGSPQAISLGGLRRIARTMRHSVELFKAAGVDMPPTGIKTVK